MSLKRAIDVSQSYTVTGNVSEKRLAFEFLNVIFSEKNDHHAYEHNLERFLFSIRDEDITKAQLINKTNRDKQEVRTMRMAQFGFSECN